MVVIKRDCVRDSSPVGRLMAKALLKSERALGG